MSEQQPENLYKTSNDFQRLKIARSLFLKTHKKFSIQKTGKIQILHNDRNQQCFWIAQQQVHEVSQNSGELKYLINCKY